MMTERDLARFILRLLAMYFLLAACNSLLWIELFCQTFSEVMFSLFNMIAAMLMARWFIMAAEDI